MQLSIFFNQITRQTHNIEHRIIKAKLKSIQYRTPIRTILNIQQKHDIPNHKSPIKRIQ